MSIRCLAACALVAVAGCQAATARIAASPPVVSTQYELRANEKAELCTLMVREAQPSVGGPVSVKQLLIAFGRTGEQSALILELARSDVLGVNGHGSVAPWPLIGTVFVLGDWSSAGIQDRVVPQAGAAKQFVTRDRAALAAFDGALTGHAISVSYQNAASGQAEAWTLPTLARPTDHVHVEAFRDCVGRIGGPSGSPMPAPPAIPRQT